MLLTVSSLFAAAFAPISHNLRCHATHRPPSCSCIFMSAAGHDGDKGDSDQQQQQQQQQPPPWWRRPPRTWPPRVDAPSLILGDLAVSYFAAYLALDVLTVGRAAEWQSEGSALASSWLVAAAVTNAWDPTAVLPSLGLRNALGCVRAAPRTRALAAAAAAVASLPLSPRWLPPLAALPLWPLLHKASQIPTYPPSRSCTRRLRAPPSTSLRRASSSRSPAPSLSSAP